MDRRDVGMTSVNNGIYTDNPRLAPFSTVLYHNRNYSPQLGEVGLISYYTSFHKGCAWSWSWRWTLTFGWNGSWVLSRALTLSVLLAWIHSVIQLHVSE